MNKLHKEIIHTLSYFGFFEYAPKFDEIYTFISKNVQKHVLQKELDDLVKRKIIKVIQGNEEGAKYTLGEYSISAQSLRIKAQNSQKKLQKVQRFIRILSLLPQIKLIGLSGSVAMNNADDDDDTDLFIITSSGRMWTARFFSLVLAHLIGVRRTRNDKSVRNKICLNLFFDESDMILPKRKHTEYGAHEVIQMKPIVDKSGTYKRFLEANMWVTKLFPNAMHIINRPTLPVPPALKRRGILTIIMLRPVSVFTESILKKVQLYLIKRHKTTEIITSTQLWFFPDDFERKLPVLSVK